ncbi:hypothetical protein RCL1_007993 [Eukaryota sp. TZLM3-RCL]
MSHDVKHFIELSSFRTKKLACKTPLKRAIIEPDDLTTDLFTRTAYSSLSNYRPTSTTFQTPSLISTQSNISSDPSPRAYQSSFNSTPHSPFPTEPPSRKSKSSLAFYSSLSSKVSSPAAKAIIADVDKLQLKKREKERLLLEEEVKRRRLGSVARSRQRSKSVSKRPESIKIDCPIDSKPSLLPSSHVPLPCNAILTKNGINSQQALAAGVSVPTLITGASIIQLEKVKKITEKKKENKVTTRTYSAEFAKNVNKEFIDLQVSKANDQHYFDDKLIALNDIDHSILTVNEALQLVRFRSAILEEQRHLEELRSRAQGHISKLMDSSKVNLTTPTVMSNHEFSISEPFPLTFDDSQNRHSSTNQGDVMSMADLSSVLLTELPHDYDSMIDNHDSEGLKSKKMSSSNDFDCFKVDQGLFESKESIDSRDQSEKSFDCSARDDDSQESSQSSENFTPNFDTLDGVENPTNNLKNETLNQNFDDKFIKTVHPDLQSWLQSKFVEHDVIGSKLNSSIGQNSAIKALEQSRVAEIQQENAKELVTRDLVNFNVLVAKNLKYSFEILAQKHVKGSFEEFEKKRKFKKGNKMYL